MLKKLLFTALLALGTSVVVASSANASTYRYYAEEKVSSGDQFNFDSNNINDSEIILDGLKDEAYAFAVDFGLKTTSSQYDVQLYVYHGDQALYLLFDVYDEYVTKRAIGANNAQDEDGVEVYIDPLLNGGTAGQKDDYRIYLGVSGFSKVNMGTGSGYGTEIIGFGGVLKTSLKPNTIPNDNTTKDEGYYLEYRIPYISISGETNKTTPLGFCFVHTSVQDINGARARTGMSGHPTFKIAYADVPNNAIVLNGDNRFYTKAAFNNLNENTPSVMGKVITKNGDPIYNASIVGYHVDLPGKLYRASTDLNGYFAFENIDTRCDFIVEASRSGFLTYTLTYDVENLINANGAEYFQTFTLIVNTETKRTITGQITALDTDALDGFNVKVVGYSDLTATTTSTGAYSIDVYNNADATLLFSKTGFEPKKVVVTKTTSTVPSFEMHHKIVNLLNPKSLGLLNNYARAGIVRGRDSIYVKVSSPYIISGDELLSLYFNISRKTAFNNNYFDGDCRVDFVDGVSKLYVYNEASHGFVLDEEHSSLITSETINSVLFETSINIPYSVLGIDNTKTFGSAIAFYNGEQYQENLLDDKYAKDEDVNPFSTMTYLRFSPDGLTYFSNNNVNTEFLYFYHGIDGAISEDIPNNADHIYMTYERDSDGLTMYVTVDEGLGTHFNTSTNLVGQEAINILLNLDGQNLTAWALYKKNVPCYDLNIRIYGDGSVIYTRSNDFAGQSSNQMWWSDKRHNNGVASNFTLDGRDIPAENLVIDNGEGYKTYTLKFTYAQLLALGGAPEDTVLDATSEIGTCLFEVSETSKTTVRFYTSSGNAWLFQNRTLTKTLAAFSAQSNYVSLVKNK